MEHASTRYGYFNQIDASSPELTGASGTESGEGSGGTSDRIDPEEHYDYDRGIPGDDSHQSFINYDEACIDLLEIDIPDHKEAPNDLLAFDVYRRAVHTICKNPNAAYNQHCIACRGQHHFEDCTALWAEGS